MITMDVKGITWVGNMYQKFENMCLEVEDMMYEVCFSCHLTLTYPIHTELFRFQMGKMNQITLVHLPLLMMHVTD